MMGSEKRAAYDELADQLAALFKGEPDLVANTANMAALIYHHLPELNWAGFYFTRPFPPPHAGEGSVGAKKGELVLGPFQGKPACVRIAWGEGVCGAAAARGSAIVVPDVDAFPGHIACDAASRSELVVPLVAKGRVVGVLDLDSPSPGRFDDADRAGCERLVSVLLAHHPDWP
jgi:L-methionine (R)-S-oxide reductase